MSDIHCHSQTAVFSSEHLARCWEMQMTWFTSGFVFCFVFTAKETQKLGKIYDLLKKKKNPAVEHEKFPSIFL